MASLFQRTLDSGNKVWALEWHDPITGRVHRKHLGSIELLSKREATLIKKDLEMQLIRKQHPVLMDAQPSITLKQLKTEYIDYCESKNLADSTILRYQRDIEQLLDILGDIPIDTIGFQDFIRWRKTLQRTKTARDKYMSEANINIAHRSIKAMFNYAIKKRNYLQNNPFVEESQLSIQKTSKPVIPHDHIQQFFAVIDDPRDALYFKCLYYYGFRPSEMVKLLSEDVIVDEEISYLIIRDRKGNDENELPILPELLDEFKRFKAEGHSRIFTQFPVDQNWLPTKVMKGYLKAANLPAKYSPKWFRHSFASRLSEDHMGVKAVLGHSSVTVTEGYTHSDLARKLQLINKQKKLV